MSRLLTLIAFPLALALLATLYFASESWTPAPPSGPENAQDGHGGPPPPAGKVVLSDQAIANLQLQAKPAYPTTYWKTIPVPGMVVDRPGHSDRGVVAPVTGVVSLIHFSPGDPVKPGDKLFTLRLLSESLHQTQTELFKAQHDIKIAEAQRSLLAAASGAIPGSQIIEVNNQLTRLEVAAKAYRRELQTRGLTPAQIDDAAAGKFISEMAIEAPAHHPNRKASPASGSQAEPTASDFVLQEVKVELGQQVQAGQTLCLLANHQLLAIEGRAFRDETPLLERSVSEGWPVAVDFQEDAAAGWPPLRQTFRIRTIANTIDPVNRTFAFQMPLENESRVVRDEDRALVLWRFRPGQKVRLLVRVQELPNVFVFPADAVTRDGAEAFVFTQNVNTFLRTSVRMVAQDRQHAVVENDGSLVPGAYVVQGSAAQLNRMTKSQNAGVPAGYHMHADGSLHKNGDEER